MIVDLQNCIAPRLLTDDYFSGGVNGDPLDLLTEDIGNLEQAIARSLKSRGLCLVIGTPEVTPGRSAREIGVKLVVQINEYVTINRGSVGTGKPAADAGLQVIALLDRWTPDYTSIWTPLAFEGMRVSSYDPELVYQVAFHTSTILTSSTQP